ncbi:hypothetical protein [Glycomyces buryatensis]|uniref:Uncharacterized protein n=1 Tax=Glycomyces buryatensis TaxID=2570927 RepID=A0A4S8Q689_9ACTN|nr:hypothetical protein [Glycomyces buryatensis]THV39630.1 hypothetical protein FAB82_17320 [Glycomyces buryatensis]
MNLPNFGPWIAVAVAIPSAVCLLIALVSLRGAPTEQRPAILYALADVARALLFRGGGSATPPEPEGQDVEVEAERENSAPRP